VTSRVRWFADAGELEEFSKPTLNADRWYESHAEAIAALPELLNREEGDPGREETMQ
jgi:hypothetical protein